MLDPDPERPPPLKRPARNSRFLIALIIVMAGVIAIQYSARPLFASDQTSTLWGMLTGLFIGGFIFGWLKWP